MRKGRFAIGCRSWLMIGLSLLAGCAPQRYAADDPKMNTFGYRQWVSQEIEPEVVLIGIHGFCGASRDYKNLGNYLLEHDPSTALYAYEIRGQGSDPIAERRGDIGSPSDWYHDLFAFTELVRVKHPDAKVVWFGESMGALIATHAWCESPQGTPPCDGLILSSPIVRFRDDIPAWTPGLVRVAATAMPLARISLDTLSGGDSVPMTENSTHDQQAKKNPYHIEKYTLRLIGTLSGLISGMNDCAAEIHSPILVLHGGQDYFNNDSDLRGFVARLPESTPMTYKNYPKAYHLLMYDTQKERVFKDVTQWVGRLKAGKL